jgi:hypothetical protein
MTGLATVCILVAFAAVVQLWTRQAPVHIVDMNGEFDHAICPGSEFEMRHDVTVDRPVLLFFYSSVMDEGENYNMPDSQVGYGARPHPRPATFNQRITWVVPELPPGKYVRVFAARGTDGDEDAVFVSKKFEIGDNCP